MCPEQVARPWPPSDWTHMQNHTHTHTCINVSIYYSEINKDTAVITQCSSNWPHILRGEGLWGHAALSGCPLLARLNPAPRGVAWEGCRCTCHWDSLIRSSRPAPDPPDTTWEAELRLTCSLWMPHWELTVLIRIFCFSLSAALVRVGLMDSYWCSSDIFGTTF